MRRVLLLCALCGCASAGTSSENTTPKQAAIFSGEQGTLFAERPRASIATIAAAPAAVWLAAKKVFADLDVPLAVENTSTHQMGNPNFYKSRVFGGQPMAAARGLWIGNDRPKGVDVSNLHLAPDKHFDGR